MAGAGDSAMEGRVRVGVVEGLTYPLPRGLAGVLAGVARILVAGGVGHAQALVELERIAPVTAVVTHREFLAFGDRLPESARLDLDGTRVYLTHLVGTPHEPLPPIRALLESDAPDVIAHGHRPRADVVWVGGTLFVCPGLVVPQKPGQPGTCVLLDIEGPGRITAHVVEIP